MSFAMKIRCCVTIKHKRILQSKPSIKFHSYCSLQPVGAGKEGHLRTAENIHLKLNQENKLGSS